MNLDNIVQIKKNLWVINSEVASLVERAASEKLPCGYAWCEIKKSKDKWIFKDKNRAKEGQASSGDVSKRVQSFESTDQQLILDVMISNFFKESHRDKKLNEWRDEHESGVRIVKNARSVELVYYETDDAFDELRIRRRTALSMITLDPLAAAINVSLHTKQFEKVAEAATLLKKDNTILADLCPRFGKTIWAGAVARISDADIVIITSYVKTSFTSFRTDLSNKIQFVEQFVHINSEDSDWKIKLCEALALKKRVFVYVSLCPGYNRQDRIDYIGRLEHKKLWIIDEADYGAHTEKQVSALYNGIQDSDKLILMTGTNPDRAVKQWSVNRRINILSCTYTELLVQKQETKRELEIL
jgi:hypothetical protein